MPLGSCVALSKWLELSELLFSSAVGLARDHAVEMMMKNGEEWFKSAAQCLTPGPSQECRTAGQSRQAGESRFQAWRGAWQRVLLAELRLLPGRPVASPTSKLKCSVPGTAGWDSVGPVWHSRGCQSSNRRGAERALGMALNLEDSKGLFLLS